MHEIQTQCPLRLRWELECRKNSFLDERQQQNAPMRRNDGDDRSQCLEGDERIFVAGDVACMRRQRALVKHRDDLGNVIAICPSSSRSTFGLLLIQTKHLEQ